jgi:hypothetical protein
MKESVKELIEGVKVGAKRAHGVMTVYCLLAAREIEEDFLTLEEALATGGFSVTEVGEGGTVPELKVKNGLDRKVLMLDGEELVGAKQNRVLNVTILVGPKSESRIPVSCVEQGRWSYRSREFTSERRQMSAELRRRKAESVHSSLAAAGYFWSDQGDVWRSIAAKFSRLEATPSSTMAMADIYKEKTHALDDYVAAFKPIETQIGIAVFINGEPAGLELLPHYAAFAKCHDKITQSYALDALEYAGTDVKPKGSPTRPRVQRLLDAVANAPVETRQSVALGHDLRIASDRVIASALEYEGRILHMSVFPIADAHPAGLSGGSMRSASLRRNRMRP